jgi:hypothetical protein
MLASIIVYAANIEYHLERSIWVLKEIDPKGIKPMTDGKTISDLFGMLESHADGIVDEKMSDFLRTWCKAARLGFSFRNDIAHGVSIKMETTLRAVCVQSASYPQLVK